MKVNLLVMAAVGAAMSCSAENGVELIQGVLAQTNHTPKPILEWRARYEFGEQDGFDAGHAATFRARVGLESQNYNGFSGLVEFESTQALNSETYNAANVHGDGNKTTIADPQSTDLNRLYLQFARDGHVARVGRQRIILDNARFVGNVGWRQNEQTFDAVTYRNTALEGLDLYYGYVGRVNRIFGADAAGAANHFKSDSHLINASLQVGEGHTLTTYAYLLDFDNSEINSTDTVGLSYAFKGKLDEYDVSALAEFAFQVEGDHAPVSYEAPYLHLNAKVARKGHSLLGGFELLGSDDGDAAFKTPLATLHKFNGWNDQFLITPVNGLRDYYIGYGLPVSDVPVTFVYHYFTSDEDNLCYGQEFDAVAVKKLTASTKAIAKASYYEAKDSGSDRTRVSLELNYTY